MNFFCFKNWLMNKAINIIVVIVFLIFVIFIIFTASICSDFKGLNVAKKVNNYIMVSSKALSTKKICWGLKRSKNHEQPELDKSAKDILDEFDGLSIGNKNSNKIYLTFDVGYDGGYMNQILDTLKSNNVNAAFFVTGQFVKTSPEIVKKIIDDGHILGNHTVNHKSMPDCSEEIINKELLDLNKKVYENFNYEMKYMRPPKGEFSEANLAYVKKLGFTPVLWSFAYDDWDDNKQEREEYGKKKILDNLHNGEIMLLHATSKDNANILDDIIKEIKNQNYQFESLDNFER